MKKKIVIPKRYIRIAKQKGTRAYQNPKTGLLSGRKSFKSGKGDSTKVKYLKKDYDINRDGKIGKNERAGRLIGRTRAVKGSKNRRGTIRRF